MAEALIEALAISSRLIFADAIALAGSPANLKGQLETARLLGFPIAQDADDGLVWQAQPFALDQDAIACELAACGWWYPLSLRLLTDSTNSQLLAAAAAGQRAPRIVVAECQHAGRGRRERRWQARYGEAILFSVLVDAGRLLRELPGLTIAIGVALARTIEKMGIEDIALKWPNDLQIDGAKLGGILVEIAGGASMAECVIGVGINWRLSALSRAEIDRPVADLHQTGCEIIRDRNVVAGRLIAAVIDAAQDFSRFGLAGFREDFARLDGIFGRYVTVDTGSQSRSGIASGIAADGSLRVRHDDGECRYHSAEVSIRAL